MGAVGGTAGPACAFNLLSVVFVVALICFVSAFVFAVIVICFNTGLDKRKEQNACEICICFVHGN